VAANEILFAIEDCFAELPPARGGRQHFRGGSRVIKKKDRTYETEKAAHEKTRLERNEQTKRIQALCTTVRGLEAKVKRLEAELAAHRDRAAMALEGEARECEAKLDLLDEIGAIVDEWRAR
jgi:outer membrane murein-binding lipoprotein Lpp